VLRAAVFLAKSQKAGIIFLMALAVARQQTADDVVKPKPFLKWAGGKTQLMAEILSRFPDSYKNYYEPFLGGGAVFFALGPKKGHLSDVNEVLIHTYKAIRDDVDKVIAQLKKHRATEQYYYRMRAKNPEKLGVVQAAARTIYLNRTCFNGLYRVNSKGEFNVPYGKYANPKICNEVNLHSVSNALKNVDIRVSSAFESAARAKKGDLVYFDPPYDPVSSTASFTSYTRGRFGRDEQAQLAELFGKLAQRGVHVVLSNSDTPFICDLYKDFRIDRVFARRAINSRADRRGKVTEVIVTAT